jgi:hypothetical protein
MTWQSPDAQRTVYVALRQAGSSAGLSVLSCQYNSTAAPYSLLYPGDGQWAVSSCSSTETVSPHRGNSEGGLVDIQFGKLCSRVCESFNLQRVDTVLTNIALSDMITI